MLSWSLFQKKDNPSSFSEFHPISLCNFLNKGFTRILCDRLGTLLPNFISDEQTGFLKGRDISDNILLAQELLQSLNCRARSHNIAFKFDMAKAFDRVSWHFLRTFLLKFGFHPAFVQLILNNLSSSWFSILLNGSYAGFFKSSGGLKQGDPLYPYLFFY